MIVQAVAMPHPPLLVPELVAGARADTEPVRSACLLAARSLAAAAGRWIAVAGDPEACRDRAVSLHDGYRVIEPDSRGTFRGYGIDVPVALSRGATAPPAELPLPALVAGWLRAQADGTEVQVWLVDPDATSEQLCAIGDRLVGGFRDEAVGLLVLADGSARHGAGAPRRADARAATFDEQVRRALAEGDWRGLRDVDEALAEELDAAGRAPWQVMAWAAAGRVSASKVLYSGVPFGVGYHVARWDLT